MSASNLPSLTDSFPLELLERIFLFTSVQDILRLSQVRNIAEVTRSGRLLSVEILKGQSCLSYYRTRFPLDPIQDRPLCLWIET